MITALPSDETMWRAFREKDASFDGVFVVAVRTTGIFCRPVCRARLPRRENVEFFGDAAKAIGHGYRACKMCRPLETSASPPKAVGRLAEFARAGDATPLRGRDLSAMGIDPSTARRQFRRHFGVTFAQYQRAARLGNAAKEVAGGAPVIRAQRNAGFESGAGFRRAFASVFGTAPSRGGATALRAAWFSTPLGAMMGVASDLGLLALDFLERPGLADAITSEQWARANAAVVPGDHPHLSLAGQELAAYFAGELREFTVPIDVRRGTAFERDAWAFLRSIPYAQTRSYSAQAAAMRRASACRAVGRANGRNVVAIIVPCHRVVGANGALTGYGGGLWRKRWLLDHERERSASCQNEKTVRKM